MVDCETRPHNAIGIIKHNAIGIIKHNAIGIIN